MMIWTMTPDPRQRYRVELDRALELGGGEAAWKSYLRAAELCLRESEEWQLDLAPTKPRRAAPGERVSASAIISDRAVMMAGRRDGMMMLEVEYRRLEQALAEVGAEDIHRVAPVQDFGRASSTIAVYGVGGPPEATHSNYVAGLLRDNAEAAAIAGAHLRIGERVSETSWRYLSNAYRDPRSRTVAQLASRLADLVAHPDAPTYREVAVRESRGWLTPENGFTYVGNPARHMYDGPPIISRRFTPGFDPE